MLLRLQAVVAALATTSKVTVDWSQSSTTSKTASTIEVDVMPFLARTPDGGDFKGYFEALNNLDAEFVRFAPWFPYPKVVVAELYEPDCSKNYTSWNTTLFDGIVKDFYSAVCGEGAMEGACTHSTAQQLSTIPSWMFVGGSDPAGLPEDPWEFPSGKFGYYNDGHILRDHTCQELAGYFARLVGWYTAGGMTDQCGNRQESGFFYDWRVLSVLNENEHTVMDTDLGKDQYIRCYDAIRDAVYRANPKVTVAGPETAGGPSCSMGEYNLMFLNKSLHKDNKPPPIFSLHVGFSGPSYGVAGKDPFDVFFSGFDEWYEQCAAPLMQKREELG